MSAISYPIIYSFILFYFFLNYVCSNCWIKYSIFVSFVALQSEPQCESASVTDEESQKRHQEEQIRQLSLQLQEQLEQQTTQGLTLPDTIGSDMDMVLDSKEEQNFLTSLA